MKKIFLSSLGLIPFCLLAQVYRFEIDTVQNFRYDTSYSINESISNNRMIYTNANIAKICFIFDLDNEIMYWGVDKTQYNSRKISKVIKSDEKSMEVWVSFDDGNVNYVLTQNNDDKKYFVFIRRKFEKEQIVGWFDPTIEIKKRP